MSRARLRAAGLCVLGSIAAAWAHGRSPPRRARRAGDPPAALVRHGDADRFTPQIMAAWCIPGIPAPQAARAAWRGGRGFRLSSPADRLARRASGPVAVMADQAFAAGERFDLPAVDMAGGRLSDGADRPLD